jgi:hypothetical protein
VTLSDKPSATPLKLAPVTVADGPSATRLADLRRQRPGDATLRDLLEILGSKLELCRRLPVYQYDAAHDGFDACAAELAELIVMERRMCERVVEMLHGHLEWRRGEHDADRSDPSLPPKHDEHTEAPE